MLNEKTGKKVKGEKIKRKKSPGLWVLGAR